MKMGIKLRNKNISLEFDGPEENYQMSRFDWTGKIKNVWYRDYSIAGTELVNQTNPNYGCGFYNEFSIDSPIGFEEADDGDWFHKIGVGLLRKEGTVYDFHRMYAVRPAKFHLESDEQRISISCHSDYYAGYSYTLRKTIALIENGFTIDYELANTGEKLIRTNEYVHNFISVDGHSINGDYTLTFPFVLDEDDFKETVNPRHVVVIDGNGFTFNHMPGSPFFFSSVSGGKLVTASWELIHKKTGIGVSETGDFETSSINLWGVGHVISPELFITIDLSPGQTKKWKRKYELFSITD